MPDYTDLKRRLEAEIAAIMGPAGADYSVEPVTFYMECKAAIAALEAERDALREALQPFAFADAEYDDIADHQGVMLTKTDNNETLNLVFMSDLRRAYSALTAPTPPAPDAPAPPQ